MEDDDELDVARRKALSPVLAVDDFRPFSSTVRVELAGKSHSGLTRTRNEDHHLIVRLDRKQETISTSLAESDIPDAFEEHGFAMLVADGLGGEGSGGVASRVAVSALAHLAIHYGRWNIRVDARTALEIMERAEWFYRRVNDAVIERSHSSPLLAGMSTTLTATFSAGKDLFLAHVGHSRAYLFRDGDLSQLTKDQTVEQRMAEAAGPAPVQRAAQDLEHILTDTIGGQSSGPQVEVGHVALRDGDQVLVCTNGLTDMASETQIAEVLALRRRVEDQCQMLIDLALAAGGHDNVTVLLARYRVPPL